jgi:hypothetical protein
MDHIQLRTATLEQMHEVIASTEMTTGSVTPQACLNTCLYHSSYTSYEHIYLFPMHNSTLKQPYRRDSFRTCSSKRWTFKLEHRVHSSSVYIPGFSLPTSEEFKEQVLPKIMSFPGCKCDAKLLDFGRLFKCNRGRLCRLCSHPSCAYHFCVKNLVPSIKYIPGT